MAASTKYKPVVKFSSIFSKFGPAAENVFVELIQAVSKTSGLALFKISCLSYAGMQNGQLPGKTVVDY